MPLDCKRDYCVIHFQNNNNTNYFSNFSVSKEDYRKKDKFKTSNSMELDTNRNEGV